MLCSHIAGQDLSQVLSCRAVGECGLYSRQLCAQPEFRSLATVEDGGERVLGSASSVCATF